MTTLSDPILLDTNVLVYAVFPAMSQHAASRALDAADFQHFVGIQIIAP